MQLDLARIYFPENLEDPFEVYQEKHFQIKQYFFQRTPIPVVVQKKIKELNELHEAFSLCNPDVQIERKLLPNFEVNFSTQWADDFHVLQNSRTKFKTTLVTLMSAQDSAELLRQWYKAEFSYAKIWAKIYTNTDLANVNVTLEPDPMRILKHLRELEFATTLDNIIALHSSLPNDLQNELKRLSKYVDLANK